MTDAWALRAIAALYLANGKPAYREALLSWLEKRVSREGEINLSAGDQSAYEKATLGAALLFADRETQDGRYRLAASALMEGIRGLSNPPRDENAALLAMEETYLLMPFQAEYDVRLGNRQLSRLIAQRFRAIRNTLAMESMPVHALGLYMASLADSLEKMDIQLYEHYRALEDLLVEAAGEALNRWNVESGMFSSNIPGSQIALGRALMCFAAMKGVRLGWLNEERYAAPAAEAFESLVQGDAFAPASDDPQDQKALFACLIALSETERRRRE